MSYAPESLDGVILRSPKAAQEEFQTKTYTPATSRRLLVSALPLLLGAGVAVYIPFALRFVNSTDHAARRMIVVFAAAVIVLLLLLAITIYFLSRQQWILEAGRLNVVDPGGMIGAGWNLVTLEPVKPRLGIKQVRILLSGRTRVLNALMFLDFDDILAHLQERVKTFERLAETSA